MHLYEAFEKNNINKMKQFLNIQIKLVAFIMLLATLMLTFNACKKQEINRTPEPQIEQIPSSNNTINKTRGGEEEFVAAVVVIAVEKFLQSKYAKWVVTYAKWVATGMPHRTYYVKYERSPYSSTSGLVVYNDFRAYRSAAQVKRYFTTGVDGDCDAYWFNNKGERKGCCYDSPAKIKYFKDHYGKIIDIGFKDGGETYSIIKLTN